MTRAPRGGRLMGRSTYYVRTSTSRTRIVKVIAQSQTQAEAAAADALDDNLQEEELDISASLITAHTAWVVGVDATIIANETEDPADYLGYEVGDGPR